MGGAYASRVAFVFERNAAADGDRVLVETAIDRELAAHALGGGRHAIHDREQRIGRTSSDDSRLAHRRARLHEKIERVVVHREWRDFRAVIPRQVFPLPTRSI